MHQIYRRTLVPKCDFNKVEHPWMAASGHLKNNIQNFLLGKSTMDHPGFVMLFSLILTLDNI